MAQFEPKCLALTDRNHWHKTIRDIHVPSMKHLAYEVTVRNVGEESAQSATVNLDLFQQGKLKASSTVTISYVPKKSKETTWVVFYEKKSSSDSVAVSSVTYVKP